MLDELKGIFRIRGRAQHFISTLVDACQPFCLKCELNDINGIQKMIYELKWMKKQQKTKIYICIVTTFVLHNILSFQQLDFWINYNEVMRVQNWIGFFCIQRVIVRYFCRNVNHMNSRPNSFQSAMIVEMNTTDILAEGLFRYSRIHYVFIKNGKRSSDGKLQSFDTANFTVKTIAFFNEAVLLYWTWSWFRFICCDYSETRSETP